jgi:HNH endonuclease.
MPAAILRYCATPGCSALVASGRCLKCQTAHVQTYERLRGTASERGYGVRWSRYRRWFLNQWQLCGDRPPGAPQTNDSQCAAIGLYVAASVVDHIVPVTGPDDPTFFTPQAHQALCETCHNIKRQRESKG